MAELLPPSNRTRKFFIGLTRLLDRHLAQDSKQSNKRRAAALFAAALARTFGAFASIDTFREDTKELAQAVNFRVGVHDGRAQIEASAAGYGIGLSIGGRIITPLTPGVLSPSLPLPFAADSEPIRWEIESSK